MLNLAHPCRGFQPSRRRAIVIAVLRLHGKSAQLEEGRTQINCLMNEQWFKRGWSAVG